MNSAGKSHPFYADEGTQSSVDETDEVYVLAKDEAQSTDNDNDSMASQEDAQSNPKSQLKLPHALGSLPSYITKSKVALTKPSSPRSSLSLGLYEFSDDKLDYLKQQVMHLSKQERESNEKAFRMTKIIDQFQQKSSDIKRELQASELKVIEQDGKIKLLRQKLKSQADKIEQIAKLESRVAQLSRTNESHLQQIHSKDSTIQKLFAETRRLRSEIDSKKKLIEAGKSEVDELKKSFATFQKRQQNLDVELDSRDVQIDILRANVHKLEQENVREN